MKTGSCVFAALLVVLGSPKAAATQDIASPVEVGGLLRAGVSTGAGARGEPDGFRLFDARTTLKGRIGLVFDYEVTTRFDPTEDNFELFDAQLTLPVSPALGLTFGLFRPSFGEEALQSRGALTFLERSQATTALAPGRQLGLNLGGTAAEGRLTYGAGVFNGNGRTFRNDGDNYMYAASVRYNSIGDIAFYDDFVFQAGASIGRSTDTSAQLGAGIVTGRPEAARRVTTAFGGSRTFWGADFLTTYRSWSLGAEYLRTDFTLDPGRAIEQAREAEAYGGFVELTYRAWGAVEAVVRYDGFHPVIGASRTFYVLGFNVYPGYYAKLGVEYAIARDDSPAGATLADGGFAFVAQVNF